MVIVGLGWLTVLRNYDYRTEFAIWDDTVAKRPSNYRAYVSRGGAQLKLGQRALAMRDFEKAIELNAEYPLAYNNRGFAHKEAGEYKLAIRDFDKAIELRPGFVQAYVNRGLTYNKMGKRRLASRDFEEAMALNPRCRLEEIQKNIRR